MHAVGASFFFIVVYLHMARALLYGSYKAPRELLWIIGMLIYLALMAEAFMGYVLPYGNMSYWGAQVIINIFGTIPGIGEPLTEWIRGDYGIGDATLTRFFSLHVVALPFLIALLDRRCTWSRCARSARTIPTASRSRKSWDRTASRSTAFRSIPTTRSRTSSAWACSSRCSPSWCSSCRLSAASSWKRRTSSRPIRCRRLSTSRPCGTSRLTTRSCARFRTRSIGALLMALSVAAFLFLPWLDRAKNKSIRYRGLLSKLLLGMFFVTSWC